MKFLKILFAASLALTPAIASAGSDSKENSRPTSGPLAGKVLDNSEVATGIPTAVIVGGLLLIGAGLVAAVGGADSNNNTK